jgi:hypothetical protein
VGYGTWVRVNDGSDVVSYKFSGSFTVLTYGPDTEGGTGNAYSPFSKQQFSIDGLSLGMNGQTGGGRDFQTFITAGTGAVWGTPVYVGPDPHGSDWIGPTTLDASWEISYQGVFLKRRYGLVDLAHRQHMHPRDAFLQDGWFANNTYTI